MNIFLTNLDEVSGDIHDFLDHSELCKVDKSVCLDSSRILVGNLVSSQHLSEDAEVAHQVLLSDFRLQRPNVN